MAIACNAESAAFRLDVYLDGAPAERPIVQLNGSVVESGERRASLFLPDIDAGRYRLRVGISELWVPYEFSVLNQQAAFVTVHMDSRSGRAVKTIRKVDLAELNGDGTLKQGTGGAEFNNGSIEGVAVSSDTGRPLRNVTLQVLDGSQETVTDRDGSFRLELPAGVYQLEVTHPDYRTLRLASLQVLAKLNLLTHIEMDPVDDLNESGVQAIEEVQVVGRYQRDNSIELERNASAVTDGIDFSQISRFDDSMVSSAIKRVVGVSLQDDRYAVVRGMKSRYQSTDFDGATLPSTDPARRDLPLDIFPAGILRSLNLQKSATADIPASATAGHISMRTREIPDEPFLKVSYSASRSEMHGQDMQMSATEGDKDWLGMDDGSRALPDALQLTLGDWINIEDGEQGYGGFDQEAIKAMGQSLQHNAIYSGRAPMDSAISLNGGRSWDLAEQRLGLIGALRYSNKWSSNRKTNFRYSSFQLDRTGEKGLSLERVGETDDSNNVIDASAMLNLQWDPGERHSFGINNVLLRHTTNSAEIETSYDLPDRAERRELILALGEDIEAVKAEDIQRFKYQRVDWIEEELLSHQLWGNHSFEVGVLEPLAYLDSVDIDWQLMKANTEYLRPNATQYAYKSQGPDDSYSGAHDYHLWEEMQEKNNGHRLDIRFPFTDLYGLSGQLQAGTHELRRDREGYYYYYRLKGFATGSNLENVDPREIYLPEYILGRPGLDGFYLSVGELLPTRDEGLSGNSYIVRQDLSASYLLADLEIYDKFRVNLGVRKETFDLAAEQYAYTIEPMTPLLDESYELPSINLTYSISDNLQLRAAWSETVSWPEIYEMVPRTFTDIETLERYTGNPLLKPARIKNYDVRIEWYPSETESVTFAIFSKELFNAIENRFDRIGDKFDYYTFDNAETAEVYGAELDVRREFVFGHNDDHAIFVQFNYADITSSVKVVEGSGVFARELERPLQGQPDYVGNLQLGYDHIDSGQELTLVLNSRGRELAVANPGLVSIPSDVYAQPYDDLKLIYKKKFFNGLSLSASLGNILDEEHDLRYENYDTPYLNYATGRTLKLQAGYDF
ncbi:TonB-dependent receptor domain-containing protein [Microbulbifer sp. 2201CG32-9]|uniref:TonB-dependent receptor domain-containing protein n=1 Tax=Microbulbifer sp. 2201CG32-9 TaxID=3232309 RepID=UPI00345BDC11